MKATATGLFAFVLAAAPAFACTDTQINGGNLQFGYAQTGGGSIAGSFVSDGDIVLDPANEGSASATFSLDGLEYLVVLGAVTDGSNFTDVGAIVVRGATAPGAGTFVFDGVNTFFVFVDDAVGYTAPTDICGVNWMLELVGAVAAGKYSATSGAVTFDVVTPTNVVGTFSGLATDPTSGTTLLISDGSFNVEDATSVDASSWGEVKNAYR
ncbi:MAG: hypothetical protein R3B81_09550 [bacterium]